MGRPFLALAGELGNNTATSLENMQPIWPKLVSGNLNCVLVAISWAQMEPVEGRYEFALIDGLIQEARRNHLKARLSMVRKLEERFVELRSLLGQEPTISATRVFKSRAGRRWSYSARSAMPRRDADARAYRALMRHIKEVDGVLHTVLMMQVENEVGVLRDSRDRSARANTAFAGPVPKELMNYLQQHKESLVQNCGRCGPGRASEPQEHGKKCSARASRIASICPFRRKALR